MGQKKGREAAEKQLRRNHLAAQPLQLGVLPICAQTSLFALANLRQSSKFPIKFAIFNTELRLRRLELLVTLLKRHPAP